MAEVNEDTTELESESPAHQTEDAAAIAPSPLQFSDLPIAVQRKLTRAYERDRLAMKPLRREMNGTVAVDAQGRRYATAKDGSHRRVEFATDGVHAIKKWPKAKWKAMKRARKRSASVAP